LQRRGSLTGNPDDLVEAARLIDDATAASGASDPVALVAAMLALDLHRLADARRWLDRVRERELWLVAATEGDLAVQEGRLDDAGALYAKARAAHGGWELLAREANLSTLRADSDGADRLYERAEADVDAKSMRTFAWLEVQRGRGAFARGRFADAQLRYDRAARGYTGYWLVEARRAELAAARGQGEQALAAYGRVAERTPSPEIAQALGELYGYLGRPAEAAPWYRRALAVVHAVGPTEGRSTIFTLWRPFTPMFRVTRARRFAGPRRTASCAPAWRRCAISWPGRSSAPDASATRGERERGGTGDRRARRARALPRRDDRNGRRPVRREGGALLQRVAALNPRYTSTFHAHH